MIFRRTARRAQALALAVSVVMASQLVGMARAEPIQLRPPQPVLANGMALDLDAHAIPCVNDWNGDGLPDLIVGYRYADKVALYRNVGDLEHPAFSGFTHLQAGGADIQHPSAGCGAPAPWVCDYDADGKRDLLVGSGLDGRVYFYRNLATDTSPLLTSGVQVTLGGNPLSVGARATPYVCDWDEDGLNDLICGEAGGQVHFFKNVGSARTPAYSDEVLMQAGGTTLNLGLRSTIRVCDWDGDGVKDLLGSGANKASWCRNLGSNDAPQLARPVPLRSPVSGQGLQNIDTGYRMRLEAADWNRDGVLDLLIGDDEGYVFLYEGYQFQVRSIACQAAGSFLLQWDSAEFLSYDILAGSTPDQIQQVVATKVASRGRTTDWTDTTQDGARFYQLSIAE